MECHLKPTWDWLVTVMDATEAQLQFGSTLGTMSDKTNQPTYSAHNSVQRNIRPDRSLRDDQLLQTFEKRRARFLPGINCNILLNYHWKLLFTDIYTTIQNKIGNMIKLIYNDK